MTQFGIPPEKWKAQLDQLRAESTPHEYVFTDEQKAFLRYARENDRPISFNTLAKVWEQNGWGKISSDCLRLKWEAMKHVSST
jgi:hypothetical protein